VDCTQSGDRRYWQFATFRYIISSLEGQGNKARLSVIARYRVSGLPDALGELSWDSSYRWFLTVHKNWVLVTPDIAVDRIIKGIVRHQTSGRSSVAG
jgi:hypothetical protein